jgi:hypothetical protein
MMYSELSVFEAYDLLDSEGVTSPVGPMDIISSSDDGSSAPQSPREEIVRVKMFVRWDDYVTVRINVCSLSDVLRQARRKRVIPRHHTKGSSLRDAIWSAHHNACIPLVSTYGYINPHDEFWQTRLWDIKNMACSGDLNQAKLYQAKLQEFYADEC